MLSSQMLIIIQLNVTTIKFNFHPISLLKSLPALDQRHHQELHQLRLQRRRLEELIQVLIISTNMLIILTSQIKEVVNQCYYQYFEHQNHFSSPRAKHAGPKGPRAESARAVTGRRNSHRWEGGRLFEPSA